MKQSVFIAILVFFHVLTHAQKYAPVVTPERTVLDTFHGNYSIRDNYRWLENTDSLEVKKWVDQQNSAADKFLSKAIARTSSYTLIDKYANVQYSNLRRAGNFYFMYATYNEGVPALFYQSGIHDEPDLLIDPNLISRKDKIVLNGYSVSKDSKLLAYQFSRNGSDWNEIKVVSLQTRSEKKDHLTGLKFSHIEWLGNGFFYKTVSQDGQFGKTMDEKICYHKIGDEQSSDTTVFRIKNAVSLDYLDYLTTSDERFLVIKETEENRTSASFYYIDYSSKPLVLKPLLKESNFRLQILDARNGKLIFNKQTKSDFGSIIEIDPRNPDEQFTIVKERPDTLLLEVIPYKDRIVAFYQTAHQQIVVITDYSGTVLKKLKFPLGYSVSGFEGNFDDEEVLFRYSNFTTPPLVYKFNLTSFKRELVKKTKISYSIETIEYKEVEYLSKDSVKIPMLLVYEKGINPDGNNPVILSAYGGFGKVETPSFNPGIVYFIKQGGIFAFAYIRGGGEKGFKWSKQGKGRYKQKSFDDFIAAAEYLIRNNYTNSQKLATIGGSNGGLVVAAAAMQRPDLFRAVVPIVAPLDMLRFDKFTVGHKWTDEYGSTDDSTDFKRILGYSPYHNISNEINYPSMLIITSENDDRVPPFHSYKFAAMLQSRSVQKNPVILKVEKGAGHGGATTLLSHLQTNAEIFGFIMNELMNR